MNGILVGALLGAAGGTAFSAARRQRAGNIKTLAALGAYLGAKLGLGAETVGTMIRRRRFSKLLNEYDDASKKQIAALARRARLSGVPVYMQSGGKPMENAMYVHEGTLDLPDAKFVDAITGKRVNRPKNRAIYIGSDYSKLPVIAHEMGHAKDFAGRSKAELKSAGALGAASLLLGLVAVAGTLSAKPGYAGMNNRRVALGASLLGIAAVAGQRSIVRKWERAASTNAMSMLSKGRRKQDIAKANDLLHAAYNTYEPIKFTDPDFTQAQEVALS